MDIVTALLLFGAWIGFILVLSWIFSRRAKEKGPRMLKIDIHSGISEFFPGLYENIRYLSIQFTENVLQKPLKENTPSDFAYLLRQKTGTLVIVEYSADKIKEMLLRHTQEALSARDAGENVATLILYSVYRTRDGKEYLIVFDASTPPGDGLDDPAVHRERNVPFGEIEDRIKKFTQSM